MLVGWPSPAMSCLCPKCRQGTFCTDLLSERGNGGDNPGPTKKAPAVDTVGAFCCELSRQCYDAGCFLRSQSCTAFSSTSSHPVIIEAICAQGVWPVVVM
jgi:hypothetical protein